MSNNFEKQADDLLQELDSMEALIAKICLLLLEENCQS